MCIASEISNEHDGLFAQFIENWGSLSSGQNAGTVKTKEKHNQEIFYDSSLFLQYGNYTQDTHRLVVDICPFVF